MNVILDDDFHSISQTIESEKVVLGKEYDSLRKKTLRLYKICFALSIFCAVAGVAVCNINLLVFKFHPLYWLGFALLLACFFLAYAAVYLHKQHSTNQKDAYISKAITRQYGATSFICEILERNCFVQIRFWGTDQNGNMHASLFYENDHYSKKVYPLDINLSIELSSDDSLIDTVIVSFAKMTVTKFYSDTIPTGGFYNFSNREEPLYEDNSIL